MEKLTTCLRCTPQTGSTVAPWGSISLIAVKRRACVLNTIALLLPKNDLLGYPHLPEQKNGRLHEERSGDRNDTYIHLFARQPARMGRQIAAAWAETCENEGRFKVLIGGHWQRTPVCMSRKVNGAEVE